MKIIGIIGAMEEEVNILKQRMKLENIIDKASMEFYKGVLEEKEVIIVRSGIGKVNAAICTQILIECFDVDFIINTGVAGSLNNNINIGDIVISSDALQHDMDATRVGCDYGVIPRMDCSIFKAEENLVQKAKQICERVNLDIRTFIGRVVSGDQFICDDSRKSWLANQFGAYCVEMEGAAIAQTAYLNKIPFLIIRAISDKSDHSAEIDYSIFEEKAIQHTIPFVINLLKEL